jgi:hypothetical protein
LKKDLFHVTYDPKKVTPEEMLEAVRKQDLHGEIVAGTSPAGPADR